jgi:hypothetical protein
MRLGKRSGWRLALSTGSNIELTVPWGHPVPENEVLRMFIPAGTVWRFASGLAAASTGRRRRIEEYMLEKFWIEVLSSECFLFVSFKDRKSSGFEISRLSYMHG